MTLQELHPRPIWTPDPDRAQDSGLARFWRAAQDDEALPLDTYDELWAWSVDRPDRFWPLLGQFFGEWGVRLTPKCLGSFKGSCDNLQWWVDGKKRTGNPARLVLKNHEEIAISVGKPPASIPTSFDFAAHRV